MKRIFWVALGATAGVLIVRRITQTAQAYTPTGLAQSVNGLGDAIRDFADRVSEAMSERELALREALTADAANLTPELAQEILRNPALGDRNL